MWFNLKLKLENKMEASIKTEIISAMYLHNYSIKYLNGENFVVYNFSYLGKPKIAKFLVKEDYFEIQFLGMTLKDFQEKFRKFFETNRKAFRESLYSRNNVATLTISNDISAPKLKEIIEILKEAPARIVERKTKYNYLS